MMETIVLDSMSCLYLSMLPNGIYEHNEFKLIKRDDDIELLRYNKKIFERTINKTDDGKPILEETIHESYGTVKKSICDGDCLPKITVSYENGNSVVFDYQDPVEEEDGLCYEFTPITSIRLRVGNDFIDYMHYGEVLLHKYNDDFYVALPTMLPVPYVKHHLMYTIVPNQDYKESIKKIIEKYNKDAEIAEDAIRRSIPYYTNGKDFTKLNKKVQKKLNKLIKDSVETIDYGIKHDDKAVDAVAERLAVAMDRFLEAIRLMNSSSECATFRFDDSADNVNFYLHTVLQDYFKGKKIDGKNRH